MNFFSLFSTFGVPRSGNESPDQIKTGDFNGDGYMDFVVTAVDFVTMGESPSRLQMYLGDGHGNFTARSDLFVTTPWVDFVPRMIVADFNGDGRSDIFGVDNGIDKEPFTGGQNKLFLSHQGHLIDATTTHLPQATMNNHGASAGDIDNDGDIDILVNALMSDGNHLMLNDGAGRYSNGDHRLPELTVPSPWGGDPLPQTHTWSGLIDVNADGWLDMILGKWDNEASSQFTNLYLNDGRGSFAKSQPIDLPSSRVVNEIVLDIQAIDLNGDALPDLALSITNGGGVDEFYQLAYVQLLVNKGDGIFVDETDARLPQGRQTHIDAGWYKSVEVVDLNRDGYDDMVLDNSQAGPRVLFNDGTGHFSESLHGMTAGLPTTGLGGFGNLAAVGDADNDGMPDLIVSREIDGVMHYSAYLNEVDGPSGLGKIDGGYDFNAIYRFYNVETGTHFYSGNRSEVENVLTHLDAFLFEGAGFSKVEPGADTVNVMRFYNTETGTHFYTADPAEAEHVRANLPAYLEEGVAYAAHSEAVEGSTALYRFFNTQTGTHFYTANADEMESVKTSLAGVMDYEGVAYYIGM
jgi:hypothetical protein